MKTLVHNDLIRFDCDYFISKGGFYPWIAKDII